MDGKRQAEEAAKERNFMVAIDSTRYEARRLPHARPNESPGRDSSAKNVTELPWQIRGTSSWINENWNWWLAVVFEQESVAPGSTVTIPGTWPKNDGSLGAVIDTMHPKHIVVLPRSTRYFDIVSLTIDGHKQLCGSPEHARVFSAKTSPRLELSYCTFGAPIALVVHSRSSSPRRLSAFLSGLGRIILETKLEGDVAKAKTKTKAKPKTAAVASRRGA